MADSTLFVYTRPQAERLRARIRNDSIRIATLRADSADLSEAVDTLRAAYFSCARERDAWVGTVEAKNEAIEALEAAQPGGLEGLLVNGPSGFVFGGAVGLTAGVVACQRAN